MFCFNCKTEMVCVDDVNNVGARIDFVECPECRARANIIYGDSGNTIEKIEWFRTKGNLNERFEHLVLSDFVIPDDVGLDPYIINTFDRIIDIITEGERKILQDTSVLSWLLTEMICIKKDGKTRLFGKVSDIFAVHPIIKWNYPNKFVKVNYNDLLDLHFNQQRLKVFQEEIGHELKVFKHLFIDFD